ncbi:MAG: bifunctional proline dehydrogenase/L-glutamate gamma-semialdehyde dehydrogenase [Desulfobacterales bacterium]|jgi:RHH-type proline utilization regulon transcriptional repressor/proline dehydrogenase/delta 1-pyrroline-5-carboxylate dehydrogenase
MELEPTARTDAAKSEISVPEEIVERAGALARQWQDRANRLLTHEEKAIQEQMMRLLTHPMDKVVLTRLIDQSFRTHNNARVADQVNSLLRRYGVPDFFSKVDRLLIQMFLGVGRLIPALSVPRMIEKMRENSSRAIIPGEAEALHAHLAKRREQGVRMNINHLGEAVLGEGEARRRLETYLEDLKNPAIEYISVKISTIYSQIQPLAFEHTVDTLVERLSRLYWTAKENVFVRKDGTAVPKFVNLDMEEYRDLAITVEAFIRTLDQEAFFDYSAGIVLQAYLPDAHPIQKKLTDWAKARVAKGGAPIKLRIVKGANMEMELVESAIFNWPLAPYDNKRDVDANYKRMVAYGMQPENIRAVHLGIASHNLFELAFAHELGIELGVTDLFYFEMLEGMADHVRRALVEMAGDVLLYAPVASKEEFINAIAYLIRRLDENTAEENFLRYAPNLKTDSRAWRFLEKAFVESCRHIDRAGTAPRRIQDRGREKFPEKMGTYWENEFVNEPDTDWSLAANRKWAEAVREKWMKAPGEEPEQIPLVIAGKEVFDKRETREVVDPNRFNEHITVARFALATEEDIDRAVETAKADPDGWRQKSAAERHEVLSKVAMALRAARGDLIGAAAANTGKIFSEADVEVSEAIDFAEYYPQTSRVFDELKNLASRGKGVGAVISPWNFPIAIPCGGIVASLAAGNTVVFKPASAAVLVAWTLCQCFWRAGVSKNVLQFVPCSGGKVGSRLTAHPDVDYVILTGGTETGLKILKEKPSVFLAAETGGKNATIVTAMSDRDQAIKNVIHSAFSNCGQKCSATSLLVLEQEVYEDEHFRRQLVDAAESFPTGSAWDFQNKMGPLIHPPAGDLKRAFSTLEPGESWLLQPQMVDKNPYIWTPGIKWGTTSDSYTHRTEFFGPLLAVMKAEDLGHAIEIVNATGYGLTSGLESLDPREQERWKSGIRAGNLYVNRGTTGAVTLRQAFGGMGKSAIGPAIKAGSPNYVAQFMRFEQMGHPVIGAIEKDHALLRAAHEWTRKVRWGQLAAHAEELKRVVRAIQSYLYWWGREFSKEKDYFHLRGQDNVLRFLPLGTVMVRVHPDDTLFEVLARIAASKICGNETIVSLPEKLENAVTEFLFGPDGRRMLRPETIRRHTDAAVAEAVAQVQRIRYAAPERVPAVVFEATAETGFYIAREPVLAEGRVELLHYLINQSICDTYHRYGNLGERTLL